MDKINFLFTVANSLAVSAIILNIINCIICMVKSAKEIFGENELEDDDNQNYRIDEENSNNTDLE